MSTDHGNNNILGNGKIIKDFGNKGRSADDIQGSDTEEATKKKLDDELSDKYSWRSPLGIEDIVLLKNFRDNGNSRVYWVGDYQHESLWGGGRNASRQVFHDACIDLILTHFNIEAEGPR